MRMIKCSDRLTSIPRANQQARGNLIPMTHCNVHRSGQNMIRAAYIIDDDAGCLKRVEGRDVSFDGMPDMGRKALHVR